MTQKKETPKKTRREKLYDYWERNRGVIGWSAGVVTAATLTFFIDRHHYRKLYDEHTLADARAVELHGPTAFSAKTIDGRFISLWELKDESASKQAE